MIGQKLINILQSLDVDEFRRLKRAISSPYFATNERLLILYGYLRGQYPTFEPQKLKKEKLFKKLYPAKPFNDGVLRVLVREFTTVTEDFIMMERLRSDKLERKKMLVKEYGNRNLYDYFKKGTGELLNGGEVEFIKDIEYFNERTDLLQAYCFHPLTNNYDVNDNSLEELMDGLDAYFVLAKYRFVQLLRNKNTIFKKKSEFRFFDMVRKEKDVLFLENELIILYELVNKLHSKEDEEIFYELKNNFFPVIDKLRRTDCRIIFYMGLNFCSRQINSGKATSHGEAYDWYNIGLKYDLLMENGKMSDATFNNVINSACYKNEFKWAEEFRLNYGMNLNEDVREDAMNYANATLLIFQEEFLQAIKILTNNKYSKPYQLRTRAAAIKAMFEQALIDTDYFNVLQYQIDASLKFLQRDKIFSESNKIPFDNFIKITGSLAKKIWSGESKQKISEWLKKKLNSSERVVLSSWLIEKVENLKS